MQVEEWGVLVSICVGFGMGIGGNKIHLWVCTVCLSCWGFKKDDVVHMVFRIMCGGYSSSLLLAYKAVRGHVVVSAMFVLWAWW